MQYRTAPIGIAIRRLLTTTLVGVATILTLGCELTTEGGMNPNAPSELGSLFSGTFRYEASTGGSSFPSASDCTELELSMTQVNETTYTGGFRAICNEGIELVGDATGILENDVLDVDATGTASLPGVASCDFTLTGTARMEGDAIRVNYTGDTCLGPISGSELLQRS